MEKLAVTKQVRISPYKAREVARLIQGKGAVEALNMVSLIPRKALIVKEALIGEGPTLKRFIPKARGSAGHIRKRTSHIRIVVTDEA